MERLVTSIEWGLDSLGHVRKALNNTVASEYGKAVGRSLLVLSKLVGNGLKSRLDLFACVLALDARRSCNLLRDAVRKEAKLRATWHVERHERRSRSSLILERQQALRGKPLGLAG